MPQKARSSKSTRHDLARGTKNQFLKHSLVRRLKEKSTPRARLKAKMAAFLEDSKFYFVKPSTISKIKRRYTIHTIWQCHSEGEIEFPKVVMAFPQHPNQAKNPEHVVLTISPLRTDFVVPEIEVRPLILFHKS